MRKTETKTLPRGNQPRPLGFSLNQKLMACARCGKVVGIVNGRKMAIFDPKTGRLAAIVSAPVEFRCACKLTTIWFGFRCYRTEQG